jgi:hypothetical protein
MAGVPNVFKQPLVEATQITFWWNAPTSDGGSPITSYILCNASPSLSYTYSGDTRSAFVRSLTTNTSYSFQVAASNAIGLGPYAPFNTVTTGIRPLPISTLSVTPSTNIITSHVSWPLNNLNSSYNLTGHVISGVPYDISGIEVIGSTIRPSFTSIATNGVIQNLGPYTYKVFAQAVNSVGYSPKTFSTIIDNVPGSALFTANQIPPSNTPLIIGPPSAIVIGSLTSFTFEWFQYMTNIATATMPRIFSAETLVSSVLSDSFGFSIINIGSGNVRYRMYYRGEDNGAYYDDSTSVASSNVVNTWKHFAVVGTVNPGPPIVKRMRLYSDGVFIYETTSNYAPMTLTTASLGYKGGGSPLDFTTSYQGYLTSFRFVTDAALYTGSGYTRPKPPLMNAPTGTTQCVFPFYSSDRLLSNTSGTDLNLLEAFPSTVTFQKFFPGYTTPSGAGGSFYFAAANPNYRYYTILTTPTQPITANSDFTIEWFQNMSSLTSQRACVFSMRTSASEYIEVAWQLGNSPTTPYTGSPLYLLVKFPQTGGITQGAVFTPITAITIQGAWVHVALVTNFSAQTFTVYINGSSVLTQGSYQGLQIGETISAFSFGNTTGTGTATAPSPSFTLQFPGYITNMRLTNGARVYTLPFTRPTPPLAAFGSGTCELLLLANTSGTLTTDSGLRTRTLTLAGVGTPDPAWNSNYPS